MLPANLLQAKQAKTEYEIKQFIQEYCFSRNIKVSFIHDSCQVEEQYAKELLEAVEKFIKE